MSAINSLTSLREGIAAAKAGNKVLARQLFRAVADQEPSNETAWLWLAGVAESPQEAMTHLHRLLAVNPDHEQARKGLQAARLQAGILEAKGRNKRTARRLLHEVTQLDPNCEVAWLWLAKVADTLEEAVACLERVLTVNPNNPHARDGLQSTRLQLGIAEARAGNREAARRSLRAVVEHDPANEQAWHWLASIAESAPEAIAALERVLALNPENAAARQTLGWHRTQLDAARAVWQCPLCRASAKEAPDVCPTCGTLFVLDDIGALLAHQPRQPAKIREAITRFRSQLESESTFATHYHLGVAHLNLGQVEEALPPLRDALQLLPEHRALQAQLEGLEHYVLEAQQRARQEQASRRRVLVVDDSPTVRKLVTMTLEKEGYAVTGAADGEEAIECLGRCLPNLVLLDITMPGMDGYQVCKLIRGHPQTAHIPVVMLSGKDGFFDKIRGRLAGSTAYVTKPFKPESLLDIASKHCRSEAVATSH